MSVTEAPFIWGRGTLIVDHSSDLFTSLWGRNFIALSLTTFFSKAAGIEGDPWVGIVILLLPFGVIIALAMLIGFAVINSLNMIHALSGVLILLVGGVIALGAALLITIFSPLTGFVTIISGFMSAVYFWRRAAEPLLLDI